MTTSWTVFPAYAGMNRYGQPIPSAEECVPRIRGDEPPTFQVVLMALTCSPHTRG